MFDDSDGGAVGDDDEVYATIDLDAVVALLRLGGVACRIEMTGGETATLFAGGAVERDGETRYVIAAGPGDYASRTAVVGEFCIGPDDGGEDPDAVFFPTTNDPVVIAEQISRRLVAEVNSRTTGLSLATAALRALSCYDAGVHSCGSADAIAAVAHDDDGEVFDEMLLIASLHGVDVSALEDSAVFVRFVEFYRKLLAEELRPVAVTTEEGV